MFSACTVPLYSKETELESHKQKASPAGKIAGVVLVPYWTWKSVSTAISGDVYIPEVLQCSLLQHVSSLRGSQKFLQRLVSHEHKAYLSDFCLIFLAQ